MHEYRVFPRTQRELLEAGMEAEDERKGHGPLIKIGSYGGDKWGGKYLRAPEIYWEVLERAGDRLVSLGEIAEVRRGFVTGCNEFFYFPNAAFELVSDCTLYRLVPRTSGLPHGLAIEAEFLRPIIKSSREFDRSVTAACTGRTIALVIPPGRRSLRGTSVAKYIQWGEKQGYHLRPTCAARQPWWQLTLLSPLFIQRSTYNRNFEFALNPHRLPIDKVMYGVEPRGGEEQTGFLGAVLNSVFTGLQIELLGNAALGQGALFLSVDTTQNRLMVPAPQCAAADLSRAFDAFSSTPTVPVDERPTDTASHDLDDAVLRALGLPSSFRDQLYSALSELVECRLSKASSL